MKLAEIHPFIRFAYQYIYPKSEGETYISRDCRLFYIIEGEFDIILNQKNYKMIPGSILLFKSGVPYSFKNNKSIKLISINFDFSQNHQEIDKPLMRIIAKNTPKNVLELFTDEISDCQQLNYPIFSNTLPFLRKTFEKIIIEHNSNNYLSNEISSTLLKECILQLLRNSTLSDVSVNASQKLNEIIKYIHENYTGDTSNITLAKLANYHPYYLNKLWKKYYGKTLHSYVLEYKLSIAEQLLVSSDELIETVATLSGFTSYVSFNENFKLKNFLTPYEYRKHFKQ